LDLSFARVGDPLGWPSAGPSSVIAPRAALQARQEVHAPGLTVHFTCPAAPLGSGQIFDPPAADIPATPALAAEVCAAMAEDLCALGLTRTLLSGPNPPALAVVRLAGYGRTAWQFAGWRAETPARGATEQEIAAFGRTMTRYIRVLDPEIGRLLEAGKDRLVALVAPLGVRARQDIGRLGSALLGTNEPTGSFTGPPPGLAILAGEGVRAGQRLPRTEPLTAVLPTLLWAQGLPAAEDMGPIVRSAFESEFADTLPVVALPSFAAQPRRKPDGPS
jgi:hypothetical protein